MWAIISNMKMQSDSFACVIIFSWPVQNVSILKAPFDKINLVIFCILVFVRWYHYFGRIQVSRFEGHSDSLRRNFATTLSIFDSKTIIPNAMLINFDILCYSKPEYCIRFGNWVPDDDLEVSSFKNNDI